MCYVLAPVVLICAGLLASPLVASGLPDRSAPPAPGPVVPFRMPPIEKLTLSNGLPVWILENHEVPVASLLVGIRSGAAADPANKPGLAAMTAALLDEGAMGKSALELDDEVTFLGASLTTAATWDASVVTIRTPVARLEQALNLLGGVVLAPEFSEAELARLKKESLTSLLLARSEPQQIATRALLQAVFGKLSRYALPLTGSGAAISSFTVSDVKKFHKEHYTSSNAILIVTGDVKSGELLPLLERVLGKWEKGSPVAPAEIPQPKASGPRKVWLIDRPGSAQSVLRIGLPGVPRATADYFQIEVMNTLLGGSFSSRLNDNLREKKGYTYGAGSRFDYRGAGGLFLAATDVDTAVTAPALTELMKELSRISTPAPQEEVNRAKNFQALGLGFDLETTTQVASQLLEIALYGLPGDFVDSYVDKTMKVSVKAVQEAAKTRIDPARLSIVAVGDLSKIEKPVRDLKLGDVKILALDDVMGPAPVIEAQSKTP